jgi:hypothetical protein
LFCWFSFSFAIEPCILGTLFEMEVVEEEIAVVFRNVGALAKPPQEESPADGTLLAFRKSGALARPPRDANTLPVGTKAAF